MAEATAPLHRERLVDRVAELEDVDETPYCKCKPVRRYICWVVVGLLAIVFADWVFPHATDSIRQDVHDDHEDEGNHKAKGLHSFPFRVGLAAVSLRRRGRRSVTCCVIRHMCFLKRAFCCCCGGGYYLIISFILRFPPPHKFLRIYSFSSAR